MAIVLEGNFVLCWKKMPHKGVISYLCWKVLSSIRLEGITSYSARQKPRIVLKDAASLSIRRYWSCTMLDGIDLVLNDTSGPTIKQLLDAVPALSLIKMRSSCLKLHYL